MNLKELKELQKVIINKNKKMKKIGRFIYIGVFCIIILIFFKYNIDIPLMLFPILLWTIIYYALFFIIRNNLLNEKIKLFNTNFKNVVVFSSLKKHFNNITYNAEKGLDELYIKKLGMINTGDSYESNDYIKGEYKNIIFEQSDIHIQEERESKDSDGNSTY